jgi:hypothetical protein
MIPDDVLDGCHLLQLVVQRDKAAVARPSRGKSQFQIEKRVCSSKDEHDIYDIGNGELVNI